LVVVAILPLVVGAISIALITVLKQQNAVSSEVSNSGDTSVLASTFVKDVQSAQQLTTNLSPSTPAACGTSSPILSLQWPVSSAIAVVSYAVQPRGSSSSLFRYYCTYTSGLNTLVSTTVVAHSVQTSPPLTAGVMGATCTQFGCTANGEPAAAAAGWTSAVGVSAVTLNVLAPQQVTGGTTTYNYSLTGVPRVSNNVSRGGTTPGHSPLVALGTGSPGISCTGHDSLTVNGTAAVNSTGTPAVQTNGTASVSATSIYTDTPSPSGAFSGSNITPPAPTQTGVSTPDPFAGLPPPITEPVPGTVTAGTTYGGFKVFGDSNVVADGPGIYLNPVSLTSAATIPSGIYIFQNGFASSGSGAISSVSGGVFFYIYRGAVSITGLGGTDLQPLASPPSPAQNLTIWMDASDTSGMTLGGNGAATVIGGTIYAPTVSAGVGGNGTIDVGSLVVGSMSCNGGGNAGQIIVNYGGS
jgi:hypothetical protein